MPLLFLTPAVASADGLFVQEDISESTANTVFATTQGKYSFGANFSSYDGGWSTTASVTRDFSFGSAGTIKVGPSIGTNDTRDDAALGVKVVGEHYQPTAFGYLFLSGQFDTIDSNWFALVQLGNGRKLSLDLSAGGSDTYNERAVAVSYKLGSTPLSLRAGYRFLAKDVFFGFALNTY